MEVVHLTVLKRYGFLEFHYALFTCLVFEGYVIKFPATPRNSAEKVP